MYKVFYHPRATKFLGKIPKKNRDKLLQKIDLIEKDPFSKKLDIKKLADIKTSYRLRVGKIRLIFEINLTLKTIYINNIDFRGNIY